MTQEMGRSNPLAFLSYVSLGDQQGRGRLSQFRERVEESDDPEVFSIAIITPRYFQDPSCRSDLQNVLERERRLSRNDLVHPIYYVRCPQLDYDARTSRDELASAMVSHEYTDWRDLRFEPADSPDVGRAMEVLAAQLRDALAHNRALPPTPFEVVSRLTGIQIPRILNRPGTPEEVPIRADPFESTYATIPDEPAAVAPPDNTPERVVDPMGRDDYVTISEAIRGPGTGDRILVHPGLYEEELVIDRPLEIVGQGNPGDLVIQAIWSNAILFRAGMGRVANLTLRQLGNGAWFCVKAVRGNLILEDCDITSVSLACVAISMGADPELKGNRIHGGKESGVIVYGHGRGALEDNDIFDNGLSGVEITSGGAPILRANRIYENHEGGVYVYNDGQGTLEDNEIYRNRRASMRVGNTGNPLSRNNQINKNAIVAAATPLKGGGRLEFHTR